MFTEERKVGFLAGVMICLAMALAMLPQMTARADEDYKLWVGGIKVTADVTSGEGWSYDKDSRTLTLDNFTYSGDGYNGNAIFYDGEGELTIQVNGNCDVAGTGNGICTGNSGLKITGGNVTVMAPEGTAILVGQANNITISGGTVTANGKIGIQSEEGNVTISGGTVTAGGETGISASSGYVTISGGTVSVTGEETAIKGNLKNSIAGTGWTDTEKTSDEEAIAVNEDGYSYSDIQKYKAMEFPVKEDKARVVTAPKAKENLKESDEPQVLIEEGKAENGYVLYALGMNDKDQPDDSVWSKDYKSMTAKAAGTYYVWYRAVDENGNTGEGTGCVIVTIDKKDTTPQDDTKGDETGYFISGTVTDKDGKGVAGVMVTILEKECETDDNGAYVIKGVPDGIYLVKAKKEGKTAETSIIVEGRSLEKVDIVFTGNDRIQNNFSSTALQMVVKGLDKLPSDLGDLNLTIADAASAPGMEEIREEARKYYQGLGENLDSGLGMEFFDVSINNGAVSEPGGVLEFVYPVDMTKKDSPCIWRFHLGAGGVPTTTVYNESETPASGNFYVEDTNGLENAKMHFFSDQFSTYAMTYSTAGAITPYSTGVGAAAPAAGTGGGNGGGSSSGGGSNWVGIRPDGTGMSTPTANIPSAGATTAAGTVIPQNGIVQEIDPAGTPAVNGKANPKSGVTAADPKYGDTPTSPKMGDVEEIPNFVAVLLLAGIMGLGTAAYRRMSR